MAKKLSKAQMKIAKLAKPFDKITKEDFAVLRSKKGTKVKGEAKKPMKFDDKVSKSIMSTSNRVTKPRKHHG
tara:strand:+ start:313 stop:528 length:216 start_codon:yes stop_codon:yes gene_type:complete